MRNVVLLFPIILFEIVCASEEADQTFHQNTSEATDRLTDQSNIDGITDQSNSEGVADQSNIEEVHRVTDQSDIDAAAAVIRSAMVKAAIARWQRRAKLRRAVQNGRGACFAKGPDGRKAGPELPYYSTEAMCTPEDEKVRVCYSSGRPW